MEEYSHPAGSSSGRDGSENDQSIRVGDAPETEITREHVDREALVVANGGEDGNVGEIFL